MRNSRPFFIASLAKRHTADSVFHVLLMPDHTKTNDSMEFQRIFSEY